MNPFGIEPSADFRNSAKGMFEMYVAHMEAGFTAEQAMQTILTALSAACGGGAK